MPKNKNKRPSQKQKLKKISVTDSEQVVPNPGIFPAAEIQNFLKLCTTFYLF